MKSSPKDFSRLLKFFRGFLFTTAALITLGALFFAEEDWRGSHAWSNYKRKMEAKGESFDPARLIPPKVPDDQNLAMIPFFTKGEGIKLPEDKVTLPRRPTWRYGWATDLTNWANAYGSPTADPVQAASNVLDALNRQEPLVAELPTARARHSCRFDIDYENWSGNTNAQAATIRQFVQVKWFFRVMSLRAQAELVSGQSNQALDDIELMFRVNDGLRDEPLLFSQLVGYATLAILAQPAAEGLAEHRWSDSQLQALQKRFQRTDLLASTRKAFEGERDFCGNPFFNGMGMKPRGWDRLEQVNFNRAIQDMLLPRIDVAARRVDPALSRSCDVAITNLSRNSFMHHRIIAATTLPASEKACIKAAAMQSMIDEAAIACALERYRLAQGSYPDTLDGLVPRFAAVLPHDVITGEPLKYRLTGDGRFILYSVGWDKSGYVEEIEANKEETEDPSRGDWVFEYPSPLQLRDHWAGDKRNPAYKARQRLQQLQERTQSQGKS